MVRVICNRSGCGLALSAFFALAAGGLGQEKRLPAKADLTPEFLKLGILPRAQGGRDTCSSFAITALADFEFTRANPRQRKRLSEEFLIWAANEATGRTGDQAMFYEAVHGLNALGICTEDLMPYLPASSANRRPSDEALKDAKGRAERWLAVWIRRWDVSRPLADEELTALKSALAGGHPVACGLRWPKKAWAPALLLVPVPNDVYDGHSIVLTGYQDDPKRKGAGVFSFRNSSGAQGTVGNGVMSYAYATAYANDALWLRVGAPGSETPGERHEAERLEIVSSQKCGATRQKMDAWGGMMWSQGAQLFCRAEQGGSVALRFPVGKAGRYRLRVLGSAAPDFGIIKIAVDGKPVAADFDLYSGRVSPAGSLELGELELASGPHTLLFTATGKNVASKGFVFGLDAVDLFPVK